MGGWRDSPAPTATAGGARCDSDGATTAAAAGGTVAGTAAGWRCERGSADEWKREAKNSDTRCLEEVMWWWACGMRRPQPDS